MKSEEKCPKCGGDLKIVEGKNGEFLACTNFPECRFSKDVNSDHGDCPQCGFPLRLIHGYYGDFLGCSNYPDCRYTFNLDDDEGEDFGA